MLDHVTAGPAGEAPASSEMPAVVRHRPQFGGRAGEYFGIWFVNLVLGVLTLGIYSAWGKVRTERYFYGNTRLAGAAFEYLADPIAILKGRLVAYAVVIALLLSNVFAPIAYLLLMLVVLCLMPMVIVLGLRFRARYSAWRGVRFRFVEEAAAGYGPFFGWPILNAISLTLAYPVMRRRQQEFVVAGHCFGQQPFSFRTGGDDGLAAYYGVYGLVVVMLLGTTLGGGYLLGKAFVAAGVEPAEAASVYGFMAAFYLAMFVAFVFARVRYTNLMWRNASLGPHRFESTLRVRDMLWLYFSNTVAIVCTIGLAVPWAMVRLARYRADHFAVVATGGLDAFLADAEQARAAAGAEMADALDFGTEFGL